MKKKVKNNNGVFYVVISLVACLGIGSAVFAFVGNASRVIENVEVYNEATQPTVAVDEGMLGANPGPDVYQRQNFHAGYQSGGEVHATTSPVTASAFILTKNELGNDTTYISWTPNLNITLTTMASTSMDFMNIPNPGDERSYWLYNASTTVASTITLAAGTGVDLQKNEDTADLATAGTSMTKLTFIRKRNTDVMLILDQFDVAD